MPQPPITKGETSKVTGIRLPRAIVDIFEKKASELKKEGYPIHLATKSKIMREVLIEYVDEAYDVFKKHNKRD